MVPSWPGSGSRAFSEPIFHIADRAEWERGRVRGEYHTAGLGAEGFIHCSSADQWRRLLEARFGGRAGLVLLEIDPSLLPADAELRWEDLEGIGELFPHVYGPLPAAAVMAVHTLSS